jgi:hypothetical protein
MKILWLTINRNKRVASHIFTGVQNELKLDNNVQIDIIERYFPQPIWYDYVKLCDRTLILEPKLKDIKYINNNYDCLICDAGFAYLDENWKNINIRKLLILEDQHGPYVKKYMNLCKDYYNTFLIRYINALDKFHPYLLNKNIYSFPHSIDPNLFKDYNLNKEYIVLSLGCMGNHYPLRKKASNILSNINKYKHIPRPKESENGKKWPINKDYAKLLNSSHSVISCTADVKYTVIKTFEIPACNSILLSDNNSLMESLGFKSGINFVEINENNILEPFNHYVLNETKRKEISQNGYNLIHNNHTNWHRKEQLLNILKG